MGCSVRRAQREVASDEFTEWIAFEELEPDPQEITAVLLAQLLARVFNFTRSKGERSRSPIDFLPHLKRDLRKAQTPKKMKTLLKGFARMHNAAIEAKR